MSENPEQAIAAAIDACKKKAAELAKKTGGRWHPSSEDPIEAKDYRITAGLLAEVLENHLRRTRTRRRSSFPQETPQRPRL